MIRNAVSKLSIRYLAPFALTLLVVVLTVAPPAETRGSPAQERVRIAVINFENNSTWRYWGDNLGAAAADEFATQLVRSQRFTVIERRELEAILLEQDLGASGRVTTSTAAQVGQLLGAQLVLTGSITKFSIDTKSGGIGRFSASYSEAESVVDVRLMNTVTGEIMVVAEGEGKKRFGGAGYKNVNFKQSYDAGIAQEALRPAVEEIISGAGDLSSLKPVVPPASIVGYRDDSNIYIDRGENYGVAVGQRFVIERVVEEIKAADGTVLDRIMDTVGTLEVTRVLSQSAICKLVGGEAAEGDRLTPAGS